MDIHKMEGGDSAKFNLRWKSYSNVLLEGTSKLLSTGQHSDVTLACDGQTVKCHRSILSTFSPVLAQFIEEMSAPGGVIFLGNGIKFGTLQTLLRFMYSGITEVTQIEMADVLKVAEELKVKGLFVANPVNGSDVPGPDQETTETDNEAASVSSQGISGDDAFAAATSPTPSPPAVMKNVLDSNTPTPQKITQTNSGNCESEGATDLTVRVAADKAETGEAVRQQAGGLELENDNNQGEGTMLQKPVKKRKRTTKVTKKVPTGIGMTTESGTQPRPCGGKKKAKKSKSSKIRTSPSPYGENMKKALDLVASGAQLRLASNVYGIPSSTLSKYVKNPEKMKSSKLYFFPSPVEKKKI